MLGRFPTGALVILLCGAPSAALLALEAAPAPPPARIVNGTPTTDYPAVGMLVIGGTLCTATLIGCSTVLTAAHCFCAPADTFRQCQRAGLPDPSKVVFLSQYALPVQASRFAIHSDYNFGIAGDVAVVTLSQPVTGIPLAALNRSQKPPLHTPATIVGFGRTGGPSDQFPEVGIKRVGSVEIAACPTSGDQSIPPANHLCFRVLTADDAGTCNGDSGGPLLVDLGAGPVVAGVASGIEAGRVDCLPVAIDFDTDVYRYREFIDQQLGNDTRSVCGDLPAVGAAGTSVRAEQGTIQPGARSMRSRRNLATKMP